MKPFRLLSGGPAPAAWNMGLDEAILEACSRNESPPTLRVYRWSPPAVTIGYFQEIDREVDREKAGEAGVDVTRRITGGGAVFHKDEITYSLISPIEEFPEIRRSSVQDSYAFLCAPIVSALNAFGLNGEFAPINDVLVSGKKISGSAQTRRRGVLLQHGTILLDLDPSAMFGILKVPREKMAGRDRADVASRVTCLNRELGRPIAPDALAAALVDSFRSVLGLPMTEGEPSAAEREAAGRLAREKFSSPEWIEKR